MPSRRETIVVVGNGMVGHRFIEQLIDFDQEKRYRVVSFCEEPRAAYDRVGLSSFFAHRDAERLMLARLDWYRDAGVELHIGDRANAIDREQRMVHSDRGLAISYDRVVLATGSYPFVPPMPGVNLRGVFVYRTIEDLERMIAFGEKSKRCAVLGGGLLGLEAAKAALDMGLETHVIEFAPRLMPRQIDDAASAILVRTIESLGVHVHLGVATKAIEGHGQVETLVLGDDRRIPVDMVIVSCGIRPRDDLARASGLAIGERGGVRVDDQLTTSDPRIFAIGEVALHSGMIYGLVAPGYQMAEIVARNLTGGTETFTGAELSTKLKLLGVDVASFGNYEAGPEHATPVVATDPFRGVYKKLFFNPQGDRLVGGILVGDASDYALLSSLAKSAAPLPCEPAQLLGLGGSPSASLGADTMSDTSQVCSCNNVSKGAILTAIRDGQLTSVNQVKACTKAGSGCGGCMPLVTKIFQQAMKEAGVAVTNHLCEHFRHSRTDLYTIIKIKQLRSFDAVLAECGSGSGCELCKPAIASILASLWNDPIQDPSHVTLQDTNDRFLANMQRGGLYSVVPRVPGGEITPDKLIAIGHVAKKYGLYTKITGGQRIDLFGAQLHQLPDIWEELIAAGFESGHAYGKAVRTVKSCVGTSWCRFGVQDSVKFAIQLEERYRGIRAPHKIKFGVSGCVRECAEAQGKDIGLVATDKGYNLYVCGNGGAKPRHADLLINDIDEARTIQLIDRFLMYYIETADKLTRTSVWLEQMEGGIDHLRAVVVDDTLGICDELESRMQYLVDTYQCEWKDVVDDPEKRKRFRQFVNTNETESGIELVDERGQTRPAYWPKQLVSIDALTSSTSNHDGGASEEHYLNLHDAASRTQMATTLVHEHVNGNGNGNGHAGKKDRGPRGSDYGASWIQVGVVSDFPVDGGAAIKYGDVQIAVFHFASRGAWYACQNMCPHQKAFVMAHGILGSSGDRPKVACPLHKKTFSLDSGDCLSGDELSIKVFPVKIEGDAVFVELPPIPQLNALLATDRFRVREERAEACAACVGCDVN